MSPIVPSQQPRPARPLHPALRPWRLYLIIAVVLLAGFGAFRLLAGGSEDQPPLPPADDLVAQVAALGDRPSSTVVTSLRVLTGPGEPFDGGQLLLGGIGGLAGGRLWTTVDADGVLVDQGVVEAGATVVAGPAADAVLLFTDAEGTFAGARPSAEGIDPLFSLPEMLAGAAPEGFAAMVDAAGPFEPSLRRPGWLEARVLNTDQIVAFPVLARWLLETSSAGDLRVFVRVDGGNITGLSFEVSTTSERSVTTRYVLTHWLSAAPADPPPAVEAFVALPPEALIPVDPVDGAPPE